MDQLKTGKFIAEMRKEQKLTQKQLADALLISDKTVSKWECGNGLPEVSLMLPLCEILKITVNELLSGKRLSSAEYQKNAEDNMVKLIKEMSETKFRLIVEAIVVFLTLLSSLSLLFVVSFVELSLTWRIVLTAISIFIMLVGIIVCALLEMRKAMFICQKCDEEFQPTKTAYIMGIHTITRRYLKCPKCGKRSWCRRSLKDIDKK